LNTEVTQNENYNPIKSMVAADYFIENREAAQDRSKGYSGIYFNLGEAF
jgi:hypothetical protein